MQIKLLVISFIVCLSMVYSTNAQHIVYVCPEGTIYSETFGYIECEPIGARNGKPQWNWGGLIGKSKKDKAPKNETQQKPMIEQAMATSSMLEIMSKQMDMLKDIDRLMKDPRRKDYIEGSWNFGGTEPNEFCSAMFGRKAVWVSVFEPGENIPGAFLMFWGLDIPKPERITKTKATLSQTGEKPQSVNVMNTTFTLNDKEKTKLGSLFFQVPTIEDALNGIENIHKFGVALNDKTVAEIEWNEGFAARDKLKQCIEKKKIKNKK